MQPFVCCDLHNPSASEFLSSVSVTAQLKSTNVQRSRLPKDTKDTKDATDHKLRVALSDWREMKTAEIYGWPSLNDQGPSLVMPNYVLNRVVDCAHHHKLQTIQDLRKETTWSDVDRFGEEVLAIIQRHAALCPSPFCSTPLRASFASINMATISNEQSELP